MTGVTMQTLWALRGVVGSAAAIGHLQPIVLPLRAA